MKPNVSRLAFASLCLALSSAHAVAENYTWTNGDTNSYWDDFWYNWSTGGDNIAWVDGNSAIFGSSGAGSITLVGTRTIASLTTNAAGYVLKEGELVLGQASTPFAINNLITINSPVTGGTNGIVKTGAGSLNLAGGLGNNFSGPIAINAGRLSNANGASLKNVTGAITVAAGATFNAQQNFDANAVANAVSLSGTGTGYDGHGALNIASNINMTGPVTLNTDVKITHDWNAGTITGAVTGTDKNLLLVNLQSGQPGLAINGNISLGTGAITIQSSTGAGFVTLGGTNSYTGGTNIGVGGLSISKGAATGTGNVTFTTSTFLRGSASLTHANPLIINSGINATMNPVSGSAFTQSGSVTGSGNLIISGPGSVLLSAGVANTFSGPVSVNAGRLAAVGSSSLKNMAGTLTVAAGATFDAQQAFEVNNFTKALTVGGVGSGIGNQGALNVQGNANWSGAITLTADTRITHDWNTGIISGTVTGTNTNLELATLNNGQPGLTVSGPLSLGTGGVTSKGAGASTIELSGALSYSGETKVETGTLILSGSARLNDASTVRVASGAVLNLNFTGTDVVGALYLGGNAMSAGTYGSLTSTATNKSADFTGNGILSVGGSGGSTYTSWASTNTGGQSSELDYDGDGVANGVEYFMGSTGSSFTTNPTVSGNSITWPKDPAAAATYVIQTSTNLRDEVTPGDGGWATATTGVVDNGTSVVYTIAPGQPKRFIRMMVTVNP